MKVLIVVVVIVVVVAALVAFRVTRQTRSTDSGSGHRLDESLTTTGPGGNPFGDPQPPETTATPGSDLAGEPEITGDDGPLPPQVGDEPAP